MFLLAMLIALLAGAANPFQTGANAELNKYLQHPFVAGAWVYLTGLAGLLLAVGVAPLMARHPYLGLGARAAAAPWWAWLGGLISILSTLAGLTLAQRLGSSVFTALTITASIVMSVLLDQFGLIGFRHHSASPARIAGCCLMVAGVWLVARS